MKNIIIIGAGMGGLVAGNLLAKKGYNVTIFEAHTAPGGYTAGFWKNGFYFESGTLSFESSWMINKAMQEIGVAAQVPFLRHTIRFCSECFDAVPKDFQEFKEMFYGAFPDEKEKLDRYFTETGKMVSTMVPLVSESALPTKIWSGLKMVCIYNKYKKTSLSEYVAHYFAKDSPLYRCLSYGLYPDMAAWILGGALASIFHDFWTARDGMQRWADVLAENFKTLGGTLQLGAKVEKIITENGKATGVFWAGKRYEGDYVISACDYKQTFLALLDNKELIGEMAREKIRSAAVSESFAVAYLGLNMSNEELARWMKVPFVMYFDEKQEADIYNIEDADFFSKTLINIYSPSLLNPALAPEGKSSLMIEATAPRGWMNNWGGGDKNAYKALKEKVKQTLIDKAVKVIPSLKEHIEYQDAATPLTFERYTLNTEGASSAWSWNPKKNFYQNWMNSHVETPVNNLFIGSCWASEMGGVPGAIGAAYRCVKKIN